MENLPGVVRYTAAHRTQKSVQIGAKLIPTQVIGAYPNYLDLGRLELMAGRFINETDQLRCRNSCVLTVPLSQRLFGNQDSVGRVVRLGGEDFRVVGLVDQPGRTMLSVPTGQASNLIFVSASADLRASASTWSSTPAPTARASTWK